MGGPRSALGSALGPLCLGTETTSWDLMSVGEELRGCSTLLTLGLGALALLEYLHWRVQRHVGSVCIRNSLGVVYKTGAGTLDSVITLY
jgi:hypothetical protein